MPDLRGFPYPVVCMLRRPNTEAGWNHAFMREVKGGVCLQDRVWRELSSLRRSIANNCLLCFWVSGNGCALCGVRGAAEARL